MQNGEFVDMTLAADGHLVKVHQVIIALASPYLKELITSAECPHPVIFLNKFSYATLSAVLEYIYTGEVLVSIENLSELIEAGKELHIRGLEDMKLHQAVSSHQRDNNELVINTKEESIDDEICYFEISEKPIEEKSTIYSTHDPSMEDITRTESMDEHIDDTFEEAMQQEEDIMHVEEVDKNKSIKTVDKPAEISVSRKTVTSPTNLPNVSVMQYTVSNQGNLQIILNRFMYYLKHTNRDGARQWRCVDYLSPSRCPAVAITKDDVVMQRMSAHTHQFHDKKILKKVQAGAIFTAIHDAEAEGASKKNGKAVDNVSE
ncbi:broad-complex core protein isoforms 1/2/3/4/5-like isoform X2 [Hyposmocoma kahamanoa]|uniref:broad-complex core protein isoforms 1/2/3/4/5-like isoform X2 n=1 Tax=Hyposmocoma kahamanoa TaxID=1477025 RepID=UPI000E6D76E0|nr:broad-complex core protein isoforms 1/2/3/4/5-like isoform X2 [Hyposmocoma kahamanoa]